MCRIFLKLSIKKSMKRTPPIQSKLKQKYSQYKFLLNVTMSYVLGPYGAFWGPLAPQAL